MKLLKILVIIVTLVMLIGNTWLVNLNNNVKADTEGEDVSTNCLDMNYIWNVTYELANVTYVAYGAGDIPRGRSYGSKNSDTEYGKNDTWC